jgi:hypothetical protein
MTCPALAGGVFPLSGNKIAVRYLLRVGCTADPIETAVTWKSGVFPLSGNKIAVRYLLRVGCTADPIETAVTWKRLPQSKPLRARKSWMARPERDKGRPAPMRDASGGSAVVDQPQRGVKVLKGTVAQKIRSATWRENCYAHRRVLKARRAGWGGKASAIPAELSGAL